MTKLKALAAATAMAVTLPMAAPAAAQMEIYENWEPGEAVTELTFVKVEAGREEDYVEGLKSTWVAANKIQQELGIISGFSMYTVPYKDDYNMILRVTFPSGEMMQPNKERYMEFLEAYGKANIEQGNETVQDLQRNPRNPERCDAARSEAARLVRGWLGLAASLPILPSLRTSTQMRRFLCARRSRRADSATRPPAEVFPIHRKGWNWHRP
mgnify:CR=1 FL=1